MYVLMILCIVNYSLVDHNVFTNLLLLHILRLASPTAYGRNHCVVLIIFVLFVIQRGLNWIQRMLTRAQYLLGLPHVATPLSFAMFMLLSFLNNQKFKNTFRCVKFTDIRRCVQLVATVFAVASASIL